MDNKQDIFDNDFNRPDQVAGHGGFQVPDGYFDQLSDRLKKIPEEVQPSKPAKVIYMKWLTWAAAAAVVALLTLPLFNTDQELAGELSSDELAELIIDQEFITDDDLILEVFVESGVEFVATATEEDPTVEYLLDHEPEITELLYEL